MKFEFLKTEKEVRNLIDWHNQNSEFVVLDTETTSLNPKEAKIIHIQMGGKEPNSAVMFDGAYLPLLLTLKCTHVWWNFKYDWHVAFMHGVNLFNTSMRDGMLIDHLVDEERPHDLDSHVQENWNDDYKKKFWERYKNYQDAPFEDQLAYACKDIVYTRRVYEKLLKALEYDGIPKSLIVHVHDLARALYRTEVSGLPVDLEYCIQLGAELQEKIVTTDIELRSLGGAKVTLVELELWQKEMERCWTETGTKWLKLPKPDFKFTSSTQVMNLLYQKLKLPMQYNSKTKQPTVDDKALEKLGDAHPLLPKLREYRKFNTMYKTFVKGILERAVDNRIYPSFNVNGTVTGRISHSDPNMGNLPSKGEWSKIRGIFVPESGTKLISCDYGQLEVCIEAHYSGDKNLLRIIHEGASKHDITAEALKIPRNLAKTLNFAMQYRCGVSKVAELCGVSMKEAQLIFDKYWETYSGVQSVYEECCEKVRNGQPIINIAGRRRRFPIEFKSKWEFEAACRQAYSSLIQGSGSELTSNAFYTSDFLLRAANYGMGLFTVHDEVLAQSKVEHLESTREIVIATMEQMATKYKLTVPLTVSCSPGLERWSK